MLHNQQEEYYPVMQFLPTLYNGWNFPDEYQAKQNATRKPVLCLEDYLPGEETNRCAGK